MTKRIKAYIAFVEALLAELESGKKLEQVEKIKAEHLIQIGFFQHERLIHLIVTVLFALMEIICLVSNVANPTLGLFLLTGSILILLIPYIKHYYLLENSVQKMYTQYDRMCQLEVNKESNFMVQ